MPKKGKNLENLKEEKNNQILQETKKDKKKEENNEVEENKRGKNESKKGKKKQEEIKEVLQENNEVIDEEVKTKRGRKKKEKNIEVKTTNTLEEETENKNTEEKTRKPRKIITKEVLTEEFDDLISSLEKEIDKLRENTKSKGIKNLRSVLKKIKVLKNHSLKIAKNKRTSTRTNTNNGFSKLVNLSKELCDFMGIKEDEKKSRVDVTKFVCNYIKEKNLQNPEDRRNILLEKDEKLKKLLNYNDNEKPLTYFRLQSALKNHFVITSKSEKINKENDESI